VTRTDTVGVQSSGRLHLGFLDLHGGLGRRFGSLGVTLEKPFTRLRLRRAASTSAEGPERERALRYLEMLKRAFAMDGGYALTIQEAVPAHAGLGSGTLLALCVGTAFCRLEGKPLDARAIASLLGRGARSGIGIGAFERGGVLLDGGRALDGAPPPIVSALPFPEEWRALLIHDRAGAGLSGEDERAAFRELPPFPEAEASRLCRLTLMQALPCLAERDLDGFGAAVAELQRSVGDYFAPRQGGARFASPRVAKALAELEAHGVKGIGQSSWGPTGFAFVGSETEGRRWLERLAGSPAFQGLGFSLTAGRNAGATVASTPEAASNPEEAAP
jgi:beta-ribofuranosylaminobenzene 5'-phosphate synthase